MVTHAYNPNTQKAKANHFKFKVKLGCTVNSRLTWGYRMRLSEMKKKRMQNISLPKGLGKVLMITDREERD